MSDLIDRQAALDALKKSADAHEENTREWQLLLRDRNIIRELPSVLAEPQDIEKYSDMLWKLAYERGKRETEPMRWIPVTERLPEEMQKVLIWERYYSHKRERYVCDYNFGWIYKNDWICEGGGESEVVAWMPLPKPYKGEQA